MSRCSTVTLVLGLLVACGESSENKTQPCPAGTLLMADGGCGQAITCPSGTHDNGAGVCVTTVTCPAGYHDGGTGACVPSVACSATYHDNGNGICEPDGQCAFGYHDGGDGTCVPSGTCSAGYHDGGDGTCLVAGTGAGGGGGGGTGGTGGLGAAGTGGAASGGAGGSIADASPQETGGAPTPDAPIAGAADLGSGGTQVTGGASGRGGTGGAGGTGGSSSTSRANTCGDGKVDPGEICDCGKDLKNLPSGCTSMNGIFYGDGKGCSNTCNKAPSCLDATGQTQACTKFCGDGNLDSGEECDDGNLLGVDGCAADCKIETGFTCQTTILPDTQTCQSGAGQCIELPIIYRDFQPENAASGGHPDFFFLGARWNGSAAPTTICVPNSGGPSKGNDSTARCWGIAAPTLQDGKPQLGTTTTCACQFSDWSIGNASRISGGYTAAGNDSPLSDGNGGYIRGTVGDPVSVTGAAGVSRGYVASYTASSPGGPIWKGTVPAVKDAASFKQWFSDDSTVNKTFASVLELPSTGSGLYQYASNIHLMQGGFFPLDTLNPSQVTQCNLWPYWNHGSGGPIWGGCSGDQFLFPPRVIQSDCPNQYPLSNGCWVTVSGQKHNFFFTSEARHTFVYDGSSGINLQIFGGGDTFVFINGQLVLDLGGVANNLPGRVTVSGNPGTATFVAGGCLDAVGNITGTTAGSKVCSPTSGGVLGATTPDDFKTGTVPLGLVPGNTYELAIFHANRSASDSNLQITLSGSTIRRSLCTPR